VKRIIILVLATIAGCTPQSQQGLEKVERATVLPMNFEADQVQLAPLNSRILVDKFYHSREYKLAWSDTLGRNASADSLIGIILKARDFGLMANDYHAEKISDILEAPISHDNAVKLDIFLTDAFLALWHHLKFGRLNSRILERIDLDSIHDVKAIEKLRVALTSNNVGQALRAQEPDVFQYHTLKKLLPRLLAIDSTDTVNRNKIQSINATLERWRWHGRQPKRLVRVNVPSYMLQVIEDDSVVLETKVIIGKPDTRTPELKSVINSFIIYPYWHVPKSIVKEILPNIQKDTLYLVKHNYDVLDNKGNVVRNSSIDWASLTPEKFPYVLRQREGSENTMGVIKFLFNNNYNVYLHDTNAPRLFSKADRALSHGCVRVRKAVALARYLIKDDYIVSPEDLDQYMQLKHRMEIRIPKPIPVHLEYFTVEPQGDSAIFYNDIYGKDAALLQALSTNASDVQNAAEKIK
jgi:L,D-transpeptidase YcbB